MDFRTKVQVEALQNPINIKHRILSLGSCFANAVGTRMQNSRFDICVNPAGTLYNPESIALILEERWDEEWAQAEGFNWLCSETKDCIPPLESYDVLLLTFGTNRVYRLKDNGHVVANCHKKPSAMFAEEDLDVAQIVERYTALLNSMRKKKPGMQVIFTVSPYRYIKYGLHGSALSKATLLLAVDRICRTVEGCHYFPAYEIVTDELRDYRFYEADMVHPSAVAADYVWERFAGTCLDSTTQDFVRDYAPIARARQHRPSNPESPEYQAFISQTKQKENAILKRYGLLPA